MVFEAPRNMAFKHSMGMIDDGLIDDFRVAYHNFSDFYLGQLDWDRCLFHGSKRLWPKIGLDFLQIFFDRGLSLPSGARQLTARMSGFGPLRWSVHNHH